RVGAEEGKRLCDATGGLFSCSRGVLGRIRRFRAKTSISGRQRARPRPWTSASRYRAQSDRGTVLTQTGAVIEMAFADGDKASIAFVCLPDTVDPRGPKGK